MASDVSGARGLASRGQGLLFPILIIASVLVIIVPMPPGLMDLLLACNITVAVVILLTTIYVRKPLEFSMFPAVLLGTTLARLVLNVASTRLILSRGGTDGTAAAGHVIEAFGQFVAGGQLALGLTIFIIILVIQFMVITKGATRISEVAARFALDGMPGKQMAIDADVNAGLLSQEQAKVRRDEISQQADFYGAMDGAGKFVRGDAIAGILITVINIFAGLYFGMVENGMPFRKAVEVFTTLTIGDGLVTQVPGFLISLAAGLLVTRTSSDSNLPKEVVGQLFRHPEALVLASGFLVALAFTGLPALPLVSLGGGCLVLGISQLRGRQAQSIEAKKQEEQRAVAETQQPPSPKQSLLADPMELQLGAGLVRLASPDLDGDLPDRIVKIRQVLAEELGMLLPNVRLRDSLDLGIWDYEIRIKDVPVARAEIRSDCLLAIDSTGAAGPIPGIDARDPISGRAAKWIEFDHRVRAETMGYGVYEPSAVIVTHLAETVREHAAELLSRQQVHELVDNLRESSPRLVDELIPNVVRVSLVHQVLCRLLAERVPIRHLDRILETLGDHAETIKDVVVLTEFVRKSLARTICRQYRDRNRVLHVVTLDPALEDVLAAGMEFTDRGLMVKLSPQVSERVVRGLVEKLQRLVQQGHPPVVLCSPQVRPGLRQITQAAIPTLAVLGLSEITRDTDVDAAAQVDVEVVRQGSRV